MKHTTVLRTGSRLALAAPLAAVAALAFGPALAVAEQGEASTACADFLAMRPEHQAGVVRGILSLRGPGFSTASSVSQVDLAVAGCQARVGDSVADVIGR
ncbi:hypothetical protein Srot_1291 [Segniliparus rotundus DSM 44985]|uniref:Uncharacterized protein n=1 Tax=Segniliparus rotundus (strain ATCC BAA-972 / CDC 1076 / CIP 108378 / DSM 44985 / JCM 13578) TaxID=640132 RepID=D6ZFN6_SEGRD|nr:hypothetical protein [Segniliparus rotundus]ADG97760.1 hypothetical protein Srot_1291 [Segniliparus rotundus DSM 44985]